MKAITPVATSVLVELIDGQPTTTSLDIAAHFGKLHKDVLKRIASLDCSPEFTERNFAPSEYTDPTGRKLTQYRLTRDGFTFLCMGFTGKEAAKWKEAYINAFNQMEQALQHGAPAKPKRHPKALPNGLTLDQQASIKALVARPPLHYPASLWLELNPHLRSALGDNRLSLGLRSLCGMDNRSPALALLGELSRAGHDVEACRLEVLAMRHHLERYWDLCRLLQTSGDNGLNAVVSVTLR